MKAWIPVLSFMALVVMADGCRRDPILEMSTNYYLKIDSDLEVLYRTVKPPKIMDAILYDLSTGKIVTENYMDPEGGVLHGAMAGTYGLLVYNFGTSSTSVENQDRNYTANATGSYISRDDLPTIYEPDHLFVARDTVTLPHISRDEEYVVECSPKSICDVWVVIVEGVRKLENAEGIVFTMSGQSKGNIFFVEDPIQEEVAVRFNGMVSDDNTLIYGVFNTFGRLDDRRIPSIVSLTIGGPNGAVYSYSADVTDQFFDPENTKHIIRIRFDEEVRPRDDGGFDPRAEPWSTDETTVYVE